MKVVILTGCLGTGVSEETHRRPKPMLEIGGRPGDNALVNGGFFIVHPRVIDRIAGDETAWEAEPLEGLARDGQLMAFTHTGFWQPMDTLRDKNRLEALWDSGQAPWKVWDK